MDPAVAKFVGNICNGSSTCTDFFTRINIDQLQKSIIEGVEEQLNYCIESQSEQQLLLLMRSMWSLHGHKLGVAGTNAKVVQEAIKIIRTNIEMHERATKFLYKNPEPMDYGHNTNTRGTKLDGSAR